MSNFRPPPPPKLSLVIPVRNETLNLKIMVKVLDAAVEVPHEVVVIYDSLEDESVAVLEELKIGHDNLLGVHNQLGKGVACAVRSGIAASKADYILIFAADELGPVLAIADMLAMMDEGCDMVSCTRYARGGMRLGGSWIGKLLSTLANRVLYMVSSTALSDCTTGVKMFRRSDADRLITDSSPIGWAFAFEMAILAQRMGLRLGEVPIVSVDRLFGGKSTFQLVSWVKAYLGHFLAAIRMLPPWPFGKRPPLMVRIPENCR
jgi:glycosyltransferase involved in cell wall biosynthesis